ncbi:hypothetical protein ABW20_dc0107035 [Dactylellina cionopaga]|nr:hypothetical protein ABW20_dc0107035 [Dactylellina cionopaga]
MAFLGSPPQSYWPSPFVADPAFDPELTDPATTLHDNQQTSLPHGLATTDNAHHLLDPALSDEMPSQAQHPIIFHQTSPHSYAPPPGFEHGLPPPSQPSLSQQPPPPPPPEQLYSPGRIVRPPTVKEMQTHNSGEVVMDDGHGAAYIAPAQHPFLGNGMHHPDMHQPLGQPPQIKFRANTNSNSGGGGHGRRPKMTKEEQMARRRLRTDTDEYRTQERERMRRRRAREKEDRDRTKQEQEDQLRAEGKESWIAPAATTDNTTTPKRKTVKMVKKKAPAASSTDEGGLAEEDASRDKKRQAKVDNRAASQETDEASPDPMEDSIDDDDDDVKTELGEEYAAATRDGTHENGEQADGLANEHHEGDNTGEIMDEFTGEGESTKEKETNTRTSARRAALAKTASTTPASSRPTRSAAKTSPAKTSTATRLAKGVRSAVEPEKIVQEVTTTRSGRTTRSALSTPKTADKKESPVPATQASATVAAAVAAAATPVPLKITTRKQTVTTPASPSSPAISKTRVSLKSLSTTSNPAATSVPNLNVAEAKSPSSVRGVDPKSSGSAGMAPVVMLFGYPAGVNPPCEVSSVSVTVESTKTNKICMMTAEDMRRPATPTADGEGEGERMELDDGNEEKNESAGEDVEASIEEKAMGDTEKEDTALDTDPALVSEGQAAGSPAAQRKSTTPDANGNGRFSWDLVVQMLKADIGFDPTTDELVGFHHKDPLLLSCDRHINTAMVMAAKEGVRMPKWYVYEKQ